MPDYVLRLRISLAAETEDEAANLGWRLCEILEAQNEVPIDDAACVEVS